MFHAELHKWAAIQATLKYKLSVPDYLVLCTISIATYHMLLFVPVDMWILILASCSFSISHLLRVIFYH